MVIPTVFTAAPAVIKKFEETPYRGAPEKTGVILSYICPLMYMNNPLVPTCRLSHPAISSGPIPAPDIIRTMRILEQITKADDHERNFKDGWFPGEVSAQAVVTRGGLNTLASFLKALQFGDKKATCGARTIGSVRKADGRGRRCACPRPSALPNGLVLYCACAMKRQPACMLFSEPIDSLAAAGAVLADVWLEDVSMPVIDSLGEDFLNYVKDDMTITVKGRRRGGSLLRGKNRIRQKYRAGELEGGSSALFCMCRRDKKAAAYKR